MATGDGRAVITYNGEVYNFVELRRDLEGRGHAFRSGTDTEVLLHLWQERGPAMLERLNGMFAFALWDRAERTLFLARDHVGVKPLYYAETPGGLVFASEVKALLPHLPTAPEVDLRLLDAYLSVGYVPGERTLFSGVRKLLPGWCLTVREGGEIALRRWWDALPQPDESMGEEECVREAMALLSDAVRLQLRSDVPLGVFLSGGVDSSAVVALMHTMGIEGIETFTVAYDFGPRYDETRWARRVAERFATRHREVFVEPREFQEFVPELVWHMDEPVTEAAAVSLFAVARLARESVTVVLSGEGSDEVFGGYPIWKTMQQVDRYHRLPAALRRVVSPALGLAGPKWRKYTDLAESPLEERYLGVSFHERRTKERLMAPELAALVDGRSLPALLRPWYEATAGRDPIARMMYVDLKSWLPDDLLVKADKMTMANSLELRVPFLDHRLVELGARIPSRLRIKGWTTKHVLKKGLEPLLPREIVHRGKMGFPTPLARMFAGPMRAYVADVLGSPRHLARGYFRPEVVRSLLAEHLSGRRDHHRVLWQLLVLEEWHRRFIDGPAQAPSTAKAVLASAKIAGYSFGGPAVPIVEPAHRVGERLGRAGVTGGGGVVTVEAELAAFGAAAVAEGGAEVEVVEAVAAGEGGETGVVGGVLAVVEAGQVGEDGEEDLEVVLAGEGGQAGERALDALPGLAVAGRPRAAVSVALSRHAPAGQPVERAPGQGAVGGPGGRHRAAARRRPAQRRDDPGIGRPAVVVAVGEEDQVGGEAEGALAQGLDLLLGVVAGDGEVQDLDRGVALEEASLEERREGLLALLDAVAGGDAVAQDDDAIGAGGFFEPPLAVAVAEPVAAPAPLVEAEGAGGVVGEAGDRLEVEARVGRELEPAAAHRRHLRRLPGGPHQELAAEQGGGAAEGERRRPRRGPGAAGGPAFELSQVAGGHARSAGGIRRCHRLSEST